MHLFEQTNDQIFHICVSSQLKRCIIIITKLPDFFILRWRQKTMFWYAHVYFYLFYVLLIITHLFKSNSWERKHYRMNNVNKQDKENKFFCVYTSRNILLIPRIYIHRKYCKLRFINLKYIIVNCKGITYLAYWKDEPLQRL